MRNDEQCKEEIIELLTTVSEVIWSGGLLMLDMMHSYRYCGKTKH